MKTARCNAKDIEDVREVKGAVGLDEDVFLDRFVTEMTHIEPQDQLIGYFLTMMAELYGEPVAKKMEKAVRRRWKLS